MIIIGFDLATKSGWCAGRPDTTPIAGTVTAPSCGEDYGAFGDFYMAFFENKLVELGQRLGPGETLLVCYEAPILPRPKWDPVAQKMITLTNIQTTRKLHALGVILEVACRRIAKLWGWVIEVFEGQIQAIKKILGGGQRSDKTQMVFAARRAGIALPDGRDAEDAADGFGAWLLAVRHKAPEHFPYWQRLLLSPAPQERMSAAEARKLLGGGR